MVEQYLLHINENCYSIFRRHFLHTFSLPINTALLAFMYGAGREALSHGALHFPGAPPRQRRASRRQLRLILATA